MVERGHIYLSMYKAYLCEVGLLKYDLDEYRSTGRNYRRERRRWRAHLIPLSGSRLATSNSYSYLYSMYFESMKALIHDVIISTVSLRWPHVVVSVAQVITPETTIVYANNRNPQSAPLPEISTRSFPQRSTSVWATRLGKS